MEDIKPKHVIGGCLTALILILAVSWIFTGNDFFLYKLFAPKQEAVRRQVFEQSRAYNEGMAQQLDKWRMEYVHDTPDQQATLRSVIRHQTADFDDSTLPPDLATWLHQIKGQQ